MLQQAVQARLAADGGQVVEVAVRQGYRPDSIRALAGRPLRIVFRREDNDPCSERVVFSTPRINRRLATTGPTTIDLPAQPPGQVRFTCGMGRYRGQIELVAEYQPSGFARLRKRASRLESPLGTALALWICALPLIALLVVLVFDGTAGLVAAGAALIVWVAGCLLALGRSAHST